MERVAAAQQHRGVRAVVGRGEGLEADGAALGEVVARLGGPLDRRPLRGAHRGLGRERRRRRRGARRVARRERRGDGRLLRRVAEDARAARRQQRPRVDARRPRRAPPRPPRGRAEAQGPRPRHHERRGAPRRRRRFLRGLLPQAALRVAQRLHGHAGQPRDARHRGCPANWRLSQAIENLTLRALFRTFTSSKASRAVFAFANVASPRDQRMTRVNFVARRRPLAKDSFIDQSCPPPASSAVGCSHGSRRGPRVAALQQGHDDGRAGPARRVPQDLRRRAQRLRGQAPGARVRRFRRRARPDPARAQARHGQRDLRNALRLLLLRALLREPGRAAAASRARTFRRPTPAKFRRSSRRRPSTSWTWRPTRPRPTSPRWPRCARPTSAQSSSTRIRRSSRRTSPSARTRCSGARRRPSTPRPTRSTSRRRPRTARRRPGPSRTSRASRRASRRSARTSSASSSPTSSRPRSRPSRRRAATARTCASCASSRTSPSSTTSTRSACSAGAASARSTRAAPTRRAACTP